MKLFAFESELYLISGCKSRTDYFRKQGKIIIKKNLSERVDFQRDTFCSDNPFCRKALKNKLSD